MAIVNASRHFSSKLLDVFVLRPDLFYLLWLLLFTFLFMDSLLTHVSLLLFSARSWVSPRQSWLAIPLMNLHCQWSHCRCPFGSTAKFICYSSYELIHDRYLVSDGVSWWVWQRMMCIIDHLLLLLTMLYLPSLHDAPTAHYPNIPCCSYVCVSHLSMYVFNRASQFSLSTYLLPHVMSLMIDVLLLFSYGLWIHHEFNEGTIIFTFCMYIFVMHHVFTFSLQGSLSHACVVSHLVFFLCCVFARVILAVHRNFVAVRHTFADISVSYILYCSLWQINRIPLCAPILRHLLLVNLRMCCSTFLPFFSFPSNFDIYSLSHFSFFLSLRHLRLSLHHGSSWRKRNRTTPSLPVNQEVSSCWQFEWVHAHSTPIPKKHRFWLSFTGL